MNAPQSTLGHVASTEAEFRAIAQLLSDTTGIVLAPGKTSMVQSRLAKRLRALGLATYKDYIALVSSEGGRDECRRMVSALTTNVTHFFRENHHFETLRQVVLPRLLEEARRGGRVRLWSAGSSNGQEAYSMAMTIAELAPDFATLNLRILATDIDPLMIEQGAKGRYPAAALEAVPEKLRKKYFRQEGEDYQVDPNLRGLVQFRELNLHDRWPMRGKFDVIFCRNVVIYFAPAAQALLWERFEEQLTPGGYLFVGHSERVTDGKHSNLRTAGVTTYQLTNRTSRI
ncbi:CheR family methyltransferase [Thioclava nitratireducens]|uniref:CheR family methyltransferase n=1 Tax=Thioclava nitratireducens TaxID=1915078 RepID=UPI00247FEEF4|nr:protein-glutamate O-methyltransferase [Thioclava nitratireducens]WGT50229.1 protein-glutamate O-methyltransferase [Thioclava nitratireducens]